MYRITRTFLFSYKVATVAYSLLFISLSLPFWLYGEVIAPYGQFSELALIDTPGTQHIENRKFSDFVTGYIPGVTNHLHGARSGWLTLWSDLNELGRPVNHIAGLSPAYLPSWIIAQFTDDPWRFITVLALFTCFIAGFFLILFCRETGLSPFAGLIAGTSYAASPLFMYWVTFPMFPAVWSWSAGALWGVTRLARKPDLLGWSILSFSTYSLLVSAYPQPVVYHAYILTGYGLYLAYRKQEYGPLETTRFLVFSISALAAGVTAALPVYIDLLHTAAESARIAPDPSFFTGVLPRLESLTEVWRFIALSTMPELFGNPVKEDFPFQYDGLSVTPLIIFFAVIGLFVSYRKTWGWWFAIAALFLLAFIHPLYVLGIKYLGFNLSRSTPLGSIMLPLTIIVAYGVDATVKRPVPGLLSRIVLIAAGTVLSVLATALLFGLTQGVAIRWGMALTILLVTVVLTTLYRKAHPLALLTALIIVVTTISQPLMLHQDATRIARSSPLVEAVRANLPAGSRFAIADPGLPVLPPNFNATVGLASVHSYNSLSSRHYHNLISQLGGVMHTYGRRNASIDPDYNSVMFRMSNIGLILADHTLSNDNLMLVDTIESIYLYSVVSRMGCCALASQPVIMSDGGIQHIDPGATDVQHVSKIVDRGDYLAFDISEDDASLLILSQKYHRNWIAKALTSKGWIDVKTAPVNGVFQGVLLPQGVSQLELRFEPYARYMWMTHLFWLGLIVIVVSRIRKQQDNKLSATEYI